MRILFTTWAWPSHLHGMVPLAWACRAAGHEVRVASQPALNRVTRDTGLTPVDVGHDVDSQAMVREYMLPEPGQPQPARTGKVPRALEMFRANAESMLDDMISFARSWQPDVLVFEPTEWAGPIVAKALGIPAVRHLFGADLAFRAQGFARELLEPLAAAHGVDDVSILGSVTIDPMPAGMQIDADYTRVPVRYVPFGGYGKRVNGELAPPGNRPRVCVSWGRTVARLAPERFLVGNVVRALSGLDVDVVVAIDSMQSPYLGELGDDVTVVTDAPLSTVVEGCDLTIAHGGAATILTSLAAGVPLMLVPQLPDHVGHSAALARLGAGVVVDLADANSDKLRETAERLVSDRSVHEAAEAAGSEIAQRPTPAQLVATPELWLTREVATATL